MVERYFDKEATGRKMVNTYSNQEDADMQEIFEVVSPPST